MSTSVCKPYIIPASLISKMEIDYDIKKNDKISTTWTISSHGYKIGVRPLVESDLPTIERMIEAEKWVKAAESVLSVQALSERGALVAVNTEGDTMAFITSVDLGPYDTAILYIIVDKKYRRMGIGRELINSLAGPQGERCISLLSYPGSEHFYFDLGFKVIENMTITVNFIQPNYDLLSKKIQNLNEKDSIVVEQKTTSILSKIASYDKKVCGYDRREYLSSIAFPETDWITVSYNKSRTEIDGYCGATIVNNETICIAPLYANSKTVAEGLFTKALLHAKEHFSFKQVKVIPPAKNSFLASFGTITKTVPLQMMSSGDINFGLSNDVFSCINTSFP